MPEHVLSYVAGQIGVNPEAYQNYGAARSGKTRREHIRTVRNLFGFRTFTPAVGCISEQWVKRQPTEHQMNHLEQQRE